MTCSTWKAGRGLTALAVLALGGFAVPAQADENVRGTGTAHFTGAPPPDIVGTVDGDLAGPFSVVILDQHVDEDGVIHLKAMHTFHTAHGDLHTMDRVRLTPTEEPGSTCCITT